MTASEAHLLMACSTLMERDRLSLHTHRPETSIISYHREAPCYDQLNSNQPAVLQPEPASMASPGADRLFVDLNEPFVGACHECTMMCIREHGASREISHGGSLSAHCFCKRVSEHTVEGGPSCWMEVPAAFVHKYLPHVDRREMVLENADGKTWLVVYSAEHGFFMGWAEFSTANQLSVGDFLLFSFVEPARFVVNVFDKEGCEKRVPTEAPQANPTRRTPNPATQSHGPNPAPSSKSPPRGFARPSPLEEARPSTCRNLKLRRLGNLRGKKKEPAWRRSPTWFRIQARLLGTRVTLRKPMLMSNHGSRIFTSNPSSLKKRTFRESLQSEGDIGVVASPGSDGKRSHSQEKRRSYSKDGALTVNCLENLHWPEGQEPSADNRQFAGNFRIETRNGPSPRDGSRQHVTADSFDDVPDLVQPESVQPVWRKQGIPRKHPLTTKPVFVSRRLSVTQAEKDNAINSANTCATHLESSTKFVVIVMRKSFVYYHFVACFPKQFAGHYMPNVKAEVKLVDEAWNAWTCSWSGKGTYMFGHGWRNFALEHCLEEGDALVMEILTKTDTVVTIKVHIFRVVPIPDGLTGWDSHILPPRCRPERSFGVPIQPILPVPAESLLDSGPLTVKREPAVVF